MISPDSEVVQEPVEYPPGETPPPAEEVASRRPRKPWITSFGIGLLVVLVFAIAASSGFKMVRVSGHSMDPVYRDGQKVIMTNWYWLVGPVRRDDIVVIRGPAPGEIMFKRAQYLAGEEVDWVNVPKNWSITSGKYRVPPGHVFVIGDNLNESSDSRDFGPIRMEDVMGKVIP